MSFTRATLNWSVAGLGVLLTATAALNYIGDVDEPLVDALERAVPALFGLCIVGYGLWIRRRERSSSQVGSVALGGVVGGAVFIASTCWILFIFSLENPLPDELIYLLLNATSVGIGVGVVVTDLSVRLREQRAELRRRTAQLEAQNDQLEMFAGIVSHDLRNPLNVATGRFNLARETELDPHADSIERALNRMNELIADMMALARNGQMIDKTAPTSLKAVSEAAWESVVTESVNLTVEDDRDVEADEARLQQLFENLFRNAIDHGGPKLSAVRVGTLPDGGFYIEDDGKGIPADDRESVWEAGHSTDPTGTGYGLAIAKSIADAHGWMITIADGDAGGARFEIRPAE
jgi:signal transduction histidine kinase